MAQINQLNLGIPIPTSVGGTGNSSLAANKILVGAGTSPMVPTNVIGGSGITINQSTPGSLIISASPSSVGQWFVVSGVSQTIVCGNGYIPDNVSQVVFTLPVTAEVGCVFEIAGLGAGGWRANCDVGQQLTLGNMSSSIGGYIESTDPTDYIRVLCVVADTIFKVLSPQGNPALF